MVTVTYDGHLRNAEHIGSNVFWNFTYLSMVEVPADLILIFILEFLGRRHSTVLSLVLSGFMSLAIIFVPEGSLHGNDKFSKYGNQSQAVHAAYKTLSLKDIVS